ncbi:MAG: glycosyltransferase, partial [Chloroflexota bacterium]
RTVHIREVTGSNPVSPTTFIHPAEDAVSDESLRIAIFGESYLPYLSGVTVSTEALARGLGAAGHDVLLVAPSPAKGAEPGTAGAIGPEPRVAWLPSFQVPGPAPAGYRVPRPIPSAALAAAAAFQPDIVHAQSPFTAGLMARRVARRLGVPLVFTHHTRFGDYRHYLGPRAGPGSALMEAYLRRFWRGCAAVVAPGSELADEIANRLGRPQRPIVRVIPSGIEVATMAALTATDPRPLAGWPPDALVAVTLGRLAPEKSVEVVVEAFAQVAADVPKLRLLVIGGGPSEAALRERASMPDLAGRVNLTGQLARGEALALAKGADLFLGASRTETQGLVLAEALALGLPVVALDGPGITDSVRDGVDGSVVPVDALGDGSRLAAALRDLVHHPARRAALAEAAVAGAGRFDVATRIGNMVALYRELLGRPRRESS